MWTLGIQDLSTFLSTSQEVRGRTKLGSSDPLSLQKSAKAKKN